MASASCQFLRVIVSLIILISSQTSYGMDKPQETTNTYFPLPTMQNWTGDYDEILKKRMLRILVPFRKTFFFVDKGNEFGVSAEAGKELEKWINNKYKFGSYTLKVVFIPKSEDQLISALRTGEGDLIAAPLSTTVENERIIDFTTPLIRDGSTILVTGPNAPQVRTIEDLAGQEIFIRQSSQYLLDIQKINAAFSKLNINPIIVRFIDREIEDEDILEAVNVGMLRYAIVHRRLAEIWSKIYTHITLRKDIIIKDNEQICWAVRKGSPLLLKEINEFIDKHAIGTSYGNEIFRRYFSETNTIRNSLSDEEYTKFTELIHIFKKYGQLYGIDPLMIAAQGYQESQLNQNKKSSRGAVGVMQLLPSTASASPIGITGIERDVDANIKAGTLYLRYIKDTYLNEPEIDEMNKILMTFAAYNAGPANLKTFRNFAREHGLNPNIWFNNVEYAAAVKIGHETVQYVGNVFDYYIAYKLVTERTISSQKAKQNILQPASTR